MANDLYTQANSDPVIAAALQKFLADQSSYLYQQALARNAAGNAPSVYSRGGWTPTPPQQAFHDTVAATPFGPSLLDGNSQVTDQGFSAAPAFTPTMLAALIGGGLFGTGLLTSDAAGAGSAAASPSAGPAASLGGSDASLLSAPSLPGFAGVPAMSAAPAAALGPMASGETGMAATAAALTPPASLAATGGALTAASPLMKALAGLGGLGAGTIAGQIGASNAVPQSLTDLITLMNQRAQSQQPLFNQVQSGLSQMLPTFAKTGGT